MIKYASIHTSRVGDSHILAYQATVTSSIPSSLVFPVPAVISKENFVDIPHFFQDVNYATRNLDADLRLISTIRPPPSPFSLSLEPSSSGTSVVLSWTGTSHLRFFLHYPAQPVLQFPDVPRLYNELHIVSVGVPPDATYAKPVDYTIDHPLFPRFAVATSTRMFPGSVVDIQRHSVAQIISRRLINHEPLNRWF